MVLWISGSSREEIVTQKKKTSERETLSFPTKNKVIAAFFLVVFIYQARLAGTVQGSQESDTT